MSDYRTVLCVEDSEDCRDLLQFVLERENYQVVSCSTSEEGLELAARNKYDAIILDHRLEEICGFEICRRIRLYDRQTPIVFFSGSAFPKDREEGLAAGGNDYLVKPMDLQRLPETLRHLIASSPTR